MSKTPMCEKRRLALYTYHVLSAASFNNLFVRNTGLKEACLGDRRHAGVAAFLPAPLLHLQTPLVTMSRFHITIMDKSRY